MDIEKYIAELMYEHDCVIIPGFGGFIGNYCAARIHPVHHTFSPPFKSVLFNINLKQNDGLLANRVSTGENISFFESLRMIATMTEKWNRLLKENKTIEIPFVGMLFRDPEGNIQFRQDKETNFLPEAFGLASFVSPAIKRPGVQKQIERKISSYLQSPAEKRRILPKTLRWAAILSLPIGIAAILSITNFDKIRNLSLNYSSLVWSATYSPPAKTSFPGKSKTPVLKSMVPAFSVVQPGTVKSYKQPVVKVIVLPKPFAIIVGAFRFRENADNLVLALRQQGHDASIIDITKNGLHRVSLQNFSTREEALARLNSVRSKDFPDAWLLHKTN